MFVLFRIFLEVRPFLRSNISTVGGRIFFVIVVWPETRFLGHFFEFLGRATPLSQKNTANMFDRNKVRPFQDFSGSSSFFAIEHFYEDGKRKPTQELLLELFYSHHPNYSTFRKTLDFSPFLFPFFSLTPFCCEVIFIGSLPP